MTITRFVSLLACGTALALGACTDTKTVPGGDPNLQGQLDEEKRTNNELRTALNGLRTSLEAAQAALGSSTPADQQMAVEQAREDLKTAQTALEAQPEGSPGKSEAAEALTALGLALTAVDDLVGASASGASGPVALASMHVTLARAQAAIDAAQVKLKAALAAAPATDTELRGLLAQAQAALTTAQVTLVPRLRQELADAQGELATANADVLRLTGELATAQARVATLTGELATAKEQAGDNAAEVTRLEGELSTAQADVRRLTGELATATAERDKQQERADTYDPRVTLGDRLTPLPKTRIGLPASKADPGSVTWKPRTMEGSVDAHPDKLEIKSDAVPYADGRLFPGTGGGEVATDEFQMRGITVRGDQLGQQPDGSNDGTINPAVMGSGAGAGNWKNYDATYESSIRMKADGSGVTLRMGGDGTIFYDMERLIALGPGGFTNQPGNVACANVDNAKCDDPTTSDVEATFGTPVADPDGEAAWHLKLPVPVNPATPTVETRTPYTSLPSGWARFTDNGEASGNTLFRVPASDDEYAEYEDEDGRYNVERAVYASSDVGDDWEPLEFRRAVRIQRGRPADELGVYNLWFSNYAGVDAGAKAADPSDDTHRYLQYAAYGLFNFLDYSTTQVRYGRLQAFHFGYDAFKDADNNRPANWGTADNPIEAKFNGKTTGWLLQSPSVNNAGAAVAISRIIRLRGDVELTAKLNAGGDGHGTISGAMRDFEFLHNGVWGDDVYHRLLENADAADHSVADDPRPGNAVILESANVKADGSFNGNAYAAANSAHDPDDSGPMGPGARTHNFAVGTYGGAFYGPRMLGELEAAGYWRLPVATGARAEAGTLLGSFGARSEPEE